MSREYRALLPAPASEPPSTSDSTSSVPETPDEPVKRRRVGVTVACNLCRSKKTRCDGARPICSVCKRRGVEKCVYSDKREASDDTLEVMDLLKSSTEVKSIEILKLLRTSGDPAVVLAILKRDSNATALAPATAPLGRLISHMSTLETELMTKYSISYPVLGLFSEGFLEQSKLVRSVTIARANSGDHQASLPGISAFVVDPSSNIGNGDIDSEAAIHHFRAQASKHNSPGRTEGLCDERLNDLDISFWTNVCIPSDIAAKAISLYLETDHPLLGTFEPGQFVTDLVYHRHGACSSFLVNVILYWACQMYSAIDKRADSYSQPLCKEAVRLWSIEKNSDTIINMVGAQMLSIAYMWNGKNHEVLVYQAEAIRMGTRLGLLGVDEKTATALLAKIPPESLHSCSFAAWGVFNWAMQFSIFYRQPGLLYPRFPPMLPIPGDSGREGSAHSGASSSHQAPTELVLPPYMGNTFPLVCEFWRIMQEISLAYFSRQEDAKDYVSPDFAELKYRELLAWVETLPTPIIRGDHSAHHVIILHIWIHCAVLDIFRPFVERGQSSPRRLRTFSASDSTPAAAYDASLQQLKRLIFDFRSNYDSSAYTMLWQTALTYVATSVLQNTKDPTWSLWLRLCIYGYETLRLPFRISEAIGRALLTMTMRDTNITSDEARKLVFELKERGLDLVDVDGDIRATFMGDLNMAASNPEGARMETLSQEFDDMAFFREFTNEEEDSEMS